MNLAIQQLEEMWRHVVPNATFKIAGTESNPQLVQIVPPNEPVVLVSFEVSMGERSGMVSLCLPYGVIEPVLGDLTKRDWFSYRRRRTRPKSRRSWSATSSMRAWEYRRFCLRTKITVKELLDLAVGDILTTETQAAAEASLCRQRSR